MMAPANPPLRPLPQDEPGILAIHCSDPRYQTHFQDFLRHELNLPRYALIAVPGGAQFLTLLDYLPKFSWAGWRWMKFMVNLTRPERVILLAHDDCRWYVETGFVRHPEGLRAQVVNDLRKVRASFLQRFGGLRVELYFARLQDGRCEFEAL